MQTVRTHIGLAQAELAKALGVSRKTIGNWEMGDGYPQAEHLKQFIVLALSNIGNLIFVGHYAKTGRF